MLYNDVVTQDCTGPASNQTCTDSLDSWMTSAEFYTGCARALLQGGHGSALMPPPAPWGSSVTAAGRAPLPCPPPP